MKDRLKYNLELISDKSKNPLTRTEFIKHGDDATGEWLDEKLNRMNTDLSGMAQKSYVDAELAKKANASDVTALQEKTNTLETTVSGKADSSTVAGISERVTQNTTKTVDLQSQIDNLVIEAGGDSNLEVVQARTDAAGVSHTTLKDRIDSEVTNLKSDLSKLNNETLNLLGIYKYPIIWRTGGFVKTSDGEIGTSSDVYKYSGFMELKNTSHIFVNTYMINTAGLAFYDTNKQFISSVSNTKNTVEPYNFSDLIEVPSNAKFMRFSTREITDDTFYALVDFNVFNERIESMKNIVSRVNMFLNYTVDGSGNIVNSDGTFRTDYFVADDNKEYKTNFKGRIAYYDASKVFISADVLGDSASSFTTPSNTKYCIMGGVLAINDYEHLYAILTNSTISDGGIDRLGTVGHFETELASYIAYKSDWDGDNGTRFYLVPKAKVTNGTGGCLKIFADNYPNQGDYRDLGIYFSANQNGDKGYYGNGVNWINVKVFDTGEYANKHPDLGFSFQDGEVVAGKIICINGQRPMWVIGSGTPTMQGIVCAEFKSNVGISTAGAGVILTSPNGTKYKLSVNDDGSLKTTVVS